MSETAYLDISSSEGTAWFDDICVNPLAAPADTLIVGQPDCLVSVNHNNLSIPIYLNNHDTVKAMDIPDNGGARIATNDNARVSRPQARN